MDDLERVEQRHSFRLPEAYRSIQALGWLDVKLPDNPSYFWLNEAEWMLPEEIADYEFQDYQKPDFVPFALTGGGDHWCCWLSEHPDAVVLCQHDSYDGEFYAPSFLGFIYRSLLDYARYVSVEDEEEGEVRQNLRRAAARFRDRFPAPWLDTLNALASAPLVQSFLPSGRSTVWGLETEQQYQEIVQRDLTFPLLDQRFEWMYPLSEAEAETGAIWRKVITESGPDVSFAEKLARVEVEVARRKGTP